MHLLRARAPEHRQPPSSSSIFTSETDFDDEDEDADAGSDANSEKPSNSSSSSSPIANPAIVYDRTLQFTTTLLGAAVYAIVLLVSLYTFLPTTLILHFDSIRSLDRAHRASLPYIIPFLLPIGVAAHAFMFTPSMAARSPAAAATASPPSSPATTRAKGKRSKAAALFDAETASLVETLRWNVGLGASGPLDDRIRVLAQRTAVVTVFGGANLAVRTWAAVAGADLVGASAWAAVWSVAAVGTGLTYAWVGND